MYSKIHEILSQKLIDISDYQITIASIIAIVFVIAATKILLILIKKLLNRTTVKKGIASGKQHSIYLLIKYFAWVVAITIALSMMGINVTILVASSAALFVGLGLGMQAIFKDLVSGIFLLFEGTVQKDDIIEVDGMVVQVYEINLRTSRVISRDDIYMIIPNHKFIDDNVVNWSHNSRLTRFHLTVGVAYGSDVELVSKVLKACMNEHKDVARIPDKEPIVRFVDFGNSSLDFKLLFWSENVFRIENTLSEIRFMINKKFRENNITIPFPQRDLHLKTSNIGTLST